MAEKYIDINRIIREVKLDMDDLKIPYDRNVKFNFSLNMKTTLGEYNPMERMIILNVKYVRSANEQEIKDLICHELIHSAYDCQECGHRGKWKQYVEIINRNKNYNICRIKK